MTSVSSIHEKDVLAACLQLLQLRDIPHWRNNTGATRIEGRYIRFGSPGSPDIVACVKGRFWAIETKRPGGRLSDAQKAVCAAIEKAEGIYLVIRNVSELNTALNAS